MKAQKICVFEYGTLKCGEKYDDVSFEKRHLKAFHRLYNKGKCRYFELIPGGLKFRSYVGVIQAGGLQIEVLPKIDKEGGDKEEYRKLLLGMLHAVGDFKVYAPGLGLLPLKQSSILDFYIEHFIRQVEYLLRTGLVKQYRTQSLNSGALKGKIDFPRHLTKNLIHQERFWQKTAVYDQDHVWNRILAQAIQKIRILSDNASIQNRIAALELCFPPVTPQRISEITFQKLAYNRKTEAYRSAIGIARLLLLNMQPDIAMGSDEVLTLMFDMNLLWEKFVYHSLRRYFRKENKALVVKAQEVTDFWHSDSWRRYLKPDIIIEDTLSGQKYVLDTKWKILGEAGPAAGDLQQLFAYARIFGSSDTALLYPGQKTEIKAGRYALKNDEEIRCSLIQFGRGKTVQEWGEEIGATLCVAMDNE